MSLLGAALVLWAFVFLGLVLWWAVRTLHR